MKIWMKSRLPNTKILGKLFNFCFMINPLTKIKLMYIFKIVKNFKTWNLSNCDPFFSQPISGHCSYFIPPENTEKPKHFPAFWWGIKWIHWPELRQLRLSYWISVLYNSNYFVVCAFWKTTQCSFLTLKQWTVIIK